MDFETETRNTRIKLLEEIGMAQAAGEPLDVVTLAGSLGLREYGVQIELEQLERLGLFAPGEGDEAPLLLTAGRQFLARRGLVSEEDLCFLGRAVDDLHARRALRVAGLLLVDEFRDAILGGRLVDHARELVPTAFQPAVDDDLALDLFAASVALMARLSNGAPAGCLAEEMITVSLIDAARAWLEGEADMGRISDDDLHAATDELGGCMWEFYEDDDVLDLFAMKDPADAALAGHNPVNRQLGVADQRVEAWFHPFSSAAATGYLREPPSPAEDADEKD